EDLCVDLENRVLAKLQCGRAGARPVSDAMSDQKLYDRLVDAFSMRDFLPSSAVPSRHDGFFATFDWFGAVSGSPGRAARGRALARPRSPLRSASTSAKRSKSPTPNASATG